MIVSKFGGTSVGTYIAMKRSASIVKLNDERRLVIISATSGTTNDLVALCDPVIDQKSKELLLQSIRDRHIRILDQFEHTTELETKIEELLFQLSAHLDSGSRDKEWQDTLLAYGELMSTTIFKEVLRGEGVQAEWLDAREIIKTDDHFGNASPLHKNIKKAASERLKKQKIYITQGFIGSDEKGRTTTLGRGGSDFSAALFAEAVNADTLEIWTDVAGVFTTDPRIVPDAFPIHQMSFNEAAELSVFGGKVLHPATLKPAIRGNVKVRVLSSSQRDEPGTWIVSKTEDNPSIRAISLRKGQTLLTVTSLDMLHQHGFLAHIFKVLADHMISVDLVTTSEVSVSLTLDTGFAASNKVELSKEVISELEEIAQVKVEKDLALIALIGNDLNNTAGISGPLFTALEDHNVRLICHGASSNNLCFLTNEEESEEIVQLLHQKFITSARNKG